MKILDKRLIRLLQLKDDILGDIECCAGEFLVYQHEWDKHNAYTAEVKAGFAALDEIVAQHLQSGPQM